MAASLTANGVSITLQGGQISLAIITGVMANAPGVTAPVSFPWTLTAAEQAASAGFVTQLVNKLAAVTGLTVTSA